jgi:tripartite-type tricarboxylate transporter receptor subunit TctC
VDTIGRLTCNELSQPLSQPLLVDNRAGAAGALGVELARNAAPDGYTLLVGSSSAITVAPLLQKAVSYQPLRDFDFISLLALLPNVLVCNPKLPIQDVAQLVAYAKAKGDASNMASAGIGSVSHLAGVALQSAAGFKSLHVPYKGGAQGVASVVAGETDWVLTPAPAAMALVQAGRLRLLGHSMATSSRPLGDAPSIASTVPGFEFVSWIGLMGPNGLPARVHDTLANALQSALQRPELRRGFEANGAVAHFSTREEFRNFVAQDIDVTRKSIAVAGVQPE